MKGFLWIVLAGIVVLAWCPWFEMEEAKQLIYAKVYANQQTLQEGCILSIDTKTLEKVPFGYRQMVGYECSLDGDFVTEGENTVLVTFFKEVINVPHPVIK
ncbi:MAG: hypothetical protein KBB91_02430 [Candidatus Pacebacteria bacterium]|jgi:hypothetical protein|nr:hypothetical protein [Candidatus Paceibacterota bacterium]